MLGARAIVTGGRRGECKSYVKAVWRLKIEGETGSRAGTRAGGVATGDEAGVEREVVPQGVASTELAL
jgi:hypothetical protein